MKKVKKPLLPVICLTLILISLLLYLLLSLGGFSFFPSHVVGEYYNDTVIEAGRYRFYGATDDAGLVIGEVKAAKRYLFLWKAIEPDSSKIIKAGSEAEAAGVLNCYEVGDTYHYFIDWTPYKQESGVDHYKYRTETITFNGKTVTLDRYSYFSSTEREQSLKIGGTDAWTVEKFEAK